MTLGWLVAPCHCSLMLNIFIFILFIFSFRAVIKHAPCTTDVEVSIFKTAGAGKQHELWILYMCFILLISSPRNSSFIDSKGCYSVAKETQDVSFIGSAVSRQSIIQHTHIIIPHTHKHFSLRVQRINRIHVTFALVVWNSERGHAWIKGCLIKHVVIMWLLSHWKGKLKNTYLCAHSGWCTLNSCTSWIYFIPHKHYWVLLLPLLYLFFCFSDSLLSCCCRAFTWILHRWASRKRKHPLVLCE